MQAVNVDIYQLSEKLKSKKLVCFGAGKMLRNFLNEYEQFAFEKKIALIIDNDEEKSNTKINIKNEKVDIVTLKKFCASYSVKDFIILITCADCVSVYEQLQQIDKVKDVECCILKFVKSMTHERDEKNRYYPENLRLYDKPQIPKVIHYCWFGRTEIPEQNKVWMASWKKYCPDYEIVEWNEDNYDVASNVYMCEAYKAKKWGFVSDYARLDIVYNYGGIYLDTDVEVIKNLDDLLYQNAFVGIDASKRISLGLGFGARPRFELIKELMDEYNNRSFYFPDGTINITAAPTLQIPFFSKLGYVNNGEYQKIGNLSIYPEKVLSGKSNVTGAVNPTENTFSIHHYDGSWNSEEKKERVRKDQELYKIFDSYYQRKNI